MNKLTDRKIIKNVINIIINRLKDKGLISLYVAGTFLTKDRTSQSDIDLFGIVKSDFNFKEEEEINKFFDKNKQELCEGIETRFRGFPICSLEGGEQKGVITYFGDPARILQRFPFFIHIWGKKFNFKKDFPSKPMELKKEALYLISKLEISIDLLRKNKLDYYQNIPKQVIELIRVEAQKEYGFKYDPSYIALSQHLIDEEDHIIHKVMKLRNKKNTKTEIINFCDDIEEYIKDLRKRIKEWD